MLFQIEERTEIYTKNQLYYLIDSREIDCKKCAFLVDRINIKIILCNYA